MESAGEVLYLKRDNRRSGPKIPYDFKGQIPHTNGKKKDLTKQPKTESRQMDTELEDTLFFLDYF